MFTKCARGARPATEATGPAPGLIAATKGGRDAGRGALILLAQTEIDLALARGGVGLVKLVDTERL